MNYKLRKCLSVIAVIMSIYTLFFFSIRFNAFNRHFYKMQSIRLELAKTMNTNEHDLYNMIDVLLDYLDGYRDDIDVKVEYHKNERLAYTDDEMKHMEDVRNLYLNAKYAAIFCLVSASLILIILRCDNKKEYKSLLAESYIKTMILLLFIMCALSIYAFSDFNAFWNNFHGVFFSNDLWMLPSSSLMIQLLPESLFMSMVIRIVMMFIGIIAILILAAVFYLKRLQKELLKSE